MDWPLTHKEVVPETVKIISAMPKVMTSPAIYRFKGRYLLAIALLLIAGIFTTPLVIMGSSHTLTISSGVLILGFFCVLFYVGAILNLRQESDVVLDGVTIGRSFFGWRWASVQWDSVKTIKIQPLNKPTERKKGVLIIVIEERVSGGKRKMEKIAFSDQITEFHDLIDKINITIRPKSIPVQYLRGGATVTRSEISL